MPSICYIFTSAGFRRKEALCYFPMPLPIPHPHDLRKTEECLINLNKGADDVECLKFCNILKMGCNCARQITEVLFSE